MLREIVEGTTFKINGLDATWEISGDVNKSMAKKIEKEFIKMQEKILEEGEENGESDDESFDNLEEETEYDIVPFIEKKYKVKLKNIG